MSCLHVLRHTQIPMLANELPKFGNHFAPPEGIRKARRNSGLLLFKLGSFLRIDLLSGTASGAAPARSAAAARTTEGAAWARRVGDIRLRIVRCNRLDAGLLQEAEIFHPVDHPVLPRAVRSIVAGGEATRHAASVFHLVPGMFASGIEVNFDIRDAQVELGIEV